MSAVRCCDAVRKKNEDAKLQSFLKHYKLDDLLNPAAELGARKVYQEDECSIESQNRTLSNFELGCTAQSVKTRLTKYGQIFVDD